MNNLLKYKKEIFKLAFGKVGENLYEFAKVVDQNNPELTKYIEKDIEKIIKILFFVNYGFENNLDNSIINLHKVYNNLLSVNIKNLNKNIRFIKDNNIKNEYRKLKKSCNINLSTFYEKSNIYWNNNPDNFDIYTKNNTFYESYLDEIKNKSEILKKIDCLDFYNNVSQYIVDFEKNIKEKLSGFHKISLRNAAIILAKVHNYKLDKNTIIKENKIYCPRAYPIHYLENNITKEVSTIIEDLDKDSIFDHYLVLVPSYNNLNFTEEIELIQNKNITPIILGETNGFCYFISNWKG